jgi:hypothetical protein
VKGNDYKEFHTETPESLRGHEDGDEEEDGLKKGPFLTMRNSSSTE